MAEIPLRKKSSTPKKKIPSKPSGKKKTRKPSGKNIESKILELYRKNKVLQAEINKAKKKYEALERESLRLTKELMEAGYIPRDLTFFK